MMRYLVIYEPSEDGFGAYVPDLPGCVAVGDTRQEVEQLIREAIALHVADLRATGQSVPLPTTQSEFVELQEA